MASPHPAPTRLRTRAGDRAISVRRALTQLARGGIACTTCGVHIPRRALQWDRLDLDAPLKG